MGVDATVAAMHGLPPSVEREDVAGKEVIANDGLRRLSSVEGGEMEVSDGEQAPASCTNRIGLGITDTGREDQDQAETSIIVHPAPPSPSSDPPTVASVSSPPPDPTIPTSPKYVPFKLKRTSITGTPSSPCSNTHGTTSPPPSAFLSPATVTSPDDWPSGDHSTSIRRTSIVFGNGPNMASIPSPRNNARSDGVVFGDETDPDRSSSEDPLPFESVVLDDDAPSIVAEGSSPFVYASPAVAHSIKEKRSSRSNPNTPPAPVARSTTPRTSAATDVSEGATDASGRPRSWLARSTSANTSATTPEESGTEQDPNSSTTAIKQPGNAAGTDEESHYTEPDSHQVNAPKPRIHAPPAIPHSANPAVARAMSPVNASGQTSLSSNGITGEVQPKRKFVLYRIHGKDKNDGNVIGTSATRRPPNHNAPAGPSKLEQVRSHTRPIFLPPKPKEEDDKHLKDWEDIMDAARHSEAKREAILEKARLEKEARMAETLPAWEALLADDKADIRERVNGNPKLRAMWFEGVPSHMRGKLWSRCIGNPLAISKDAFNTYNARAQRAVKGGRFPPDVLERIDQDSATTLPATKLYQAGTPMQEELRDLLLAWFVSRFDDGLGYTSTVRHIAGMLLLTMNLSLAFVALRNLLDRPCLRAFYCDLSDQIEAYYRIFENLQGELFPKIYANCKHLGVRLPASYFTTIFLHQLSYETANRVWDLVMLDGDGHIFRVALGILSILEPRLYFPDRKEITSVLEGNNPASLAITARERERAKQRGEVVIEETDGVLTALGVNETTLFEALSMDNWKEARFGRLSQRELPD